jgi:hypothetical protein
MNRSYVKQNDGCPAYLDDLRRFGETAEDYGGGQTLVYISDELEAVNFIKECERLKITVIKPLLKKENKFIIDLPFHNYRYIPETRIFKINNNLDFF